MSKSAVARKNCGAKPLAQRRRHSTTQGVALRGTGPRSTVNRTPMTAHGLSSENAHHPVTQGQDDEQLVAQAQAGEKQAFNFLVCKYQSRVTALAKRYVAEADAEDVAQEAFIKAYRALSAFRGDSAFYTWMHRITINSCMNHLLARSRRPAAQDIDIADAELFGHAEQLSDIKTPEAQLLAEELEHKLVRTIDRLPTEMREAIVLRELEGLSYEEISEQMECPVGTVRSRLFRAREVVDAVVEPLLTSG